MALNKASKELVAQVQEIEQEEQGRLREIVSQI